MYKNLVPPGPRAPVVACFIPALMSRVLRIDGQFFGLPQDALWSAA